MTTHRHDDTLLYLDGVTVSFDGFRALNALCLVLERGEMRAVIGPNGAGKTTMMDVITGKTRPDTGKVVFGKDTDLTRLDEPAIADLGIGRKFQKPTVFEPHTVWDNLLLALAGDRRPRFTLWARQSGEERDRIEGILTTIRLNEHRERRAGDLSHGQKQWLEIGMLLAQEPQLLLVDEPVAGMTDAETEQTARVAPPPAYGAISTVQPREHGGNLDNKELGEGSTLFLPVWAPGALFSAGDGHGVQGDGEVCINALEICLTGTFTLTLHKGGGARAPLLTYPRAETATHFISMGMHEDLDVAMKTALRQMIAFITSRTNLSRQEAYQFCPWRWTFTSRRR